MTGAFATTADFGGHSLTSAGESDIYIAKVLPNGDIDLVQRGGGIANDNSFDIAVDPNGNIFVTGRFSETVNLGDQSLTSAGSRDAFIAHLNGTDLRFVDSWRIGGESSDEGEAIAADLSGNVYATGGFRTLPVFPRATW